MSVVPAVAISVLVFVAVLVIGLAVANWFIGGGRGDR